MQATLESPQTHTGLFDQYGRCIPGDHLQKPVFAQSRRYFRFQPPAIDLSVCYGRLVNHLQGANQITEADFKRRVESVLAQLQADPATAALCQGPYVPFVLPKQGLADIGSQLERVYLPAVKASFEQAYPGKTFTNHHKDGLTGKLSIALGSRHERLLDAQAADAMVGIYFPALMEYSVPAAIEKVGQLPERFLLAGGFDTAAALVAAPELLLRLDGYPPVLWMAALDTEKAGVNYLFEAYGYHLTFNRKPHFDQAAESWASGLVVLG